MPLNIIKQVIDIKETEGKLTILLESGQRHVRCTIPILICLSLTSIFLSIEFPRHVLVSVYLIGNLAIHAT